MDVISSSEGISTYHVIKHKLHLSSICDENASKLYMSGHYLITERKAYKRDKSIEPLSLQVVLAKMQTIGALHSLFRIHCSKDKSVLPDPMTKTE